MVKGEERREKGKTASPNNGREGFYPSTFTLISSPSNGTFGISFCLTDRV
jgi:hypothetical protein